MKRLLAFAVSALLLCGYGARAQGIDLSSVDLFLETAEQIRAGNLPSDEQWEQLFQSPGYNAALRSDLRREIVRDMMLLAFAPERIAQREPVLAVTLEGNTDPRAILNKITLENFLDMQGHWQELKELRRTYDFSWLPGLAAARLEEFMVDPMDRSVVLPTIYLLCYEPDAHGGDRITMDYNLFFKYTEQENIDLLAHEMFHTYRQQQKPRYWQRIYWNPLSLVLSFWQDEGIADLIDKQDAQQALGMSESQIAHYIRLRDATPDVLRTADSLTCGFARGEVDEDTFKTELMKFIGEMGGHPNGYYLSRYIEQAGLREEMLRSYDSPFEFARLYNRAAEKLGGYILSREMMEYLDKLEAEVTEYLQAQEGSTEG